LKLGVNLEVTGDIGRFARYSGDIRKKRAIVKGCRQVKKVY
jgi:hypothetical protein